MSMRIKSTEKSALMNIHEAAEELNCSPYSLRKWIAEKRIPVVRLGRAVRIRKTDINEIKYKGL